MLATALKLGVLSLLALKPAAIPTVPKSAPPAAPAKTAPRPGPKPASTQTNPGGGSAAGCTSFDLRLPNLAFDPLDKRVRGDREMAGAAVRIRVDASIEILNDKLFLDTSVTFGEGKGDFSTFRGILEDKLVFDAKKISSACRIVGFTGLSETHFARSTANDHSMRDYPNEDGKLIANARCRTDTKSSKGFLTKTVDFGLVGCEAISFVPVRIKLEKIPAGCGPIRIDVPTRGMYPFSSHTEGDTEVSGNRARLRVTSTARIEQTGVRLVTKGEIRELVPDHTTFEQLDDPFIFTTPPHCRVSKVEPATGRAEFVAGVNDHATHRHIGDGLLKNASCRTDRKGRDRGHVGCREINYRTITVHTVPK